MYIKSILLILLATLLASCNMSFLTGEGESNFEFKEEPINKDNLDQESKTISLIETMKPSGVIDTKESYILLEVKTKESANCRYSPTEQLFSSMAGVLAANPSGINHVAMATIEAGKSYYYFVSCENKQKKSSFTKAISFNVMDAQVPTPLPVPQMAVLSNLKPSGSYFENIGFVNLELDTDQASLCRFADQDLSFSQMPNAFQANSNGLSHSYYLPTTAQKTYQIFVRCQTLKGAINNSSKLISFDTNLKIDNTPPIISNPQPIGVKETNELTQRLSVNTGESSICKYDVNFVAYANMSNAMTAANNGITHSSTINIQAGQSYRYYVLCKDISNNISTAPTVIAFSIKKPEVKDTIAPIISNYSSLQTLEANITEAIISLSTNEVATCRYSMNAQDNYTQMSMLNMTGDRSHSQMVTGLQSGSNYKYFVTCRDQAQNVSNKIELTISVKKLDINLAARVILEQKCSQCHGDQLMLKGLNVLNNDSLFDKIEKFIVKGVPEQSKIYLSLIKNQGFMPPAGKLSSNEIGIIESWIAGMPKDVTPPQAVICDEDDDFKASLTRRLTKKELEISIRDVFGVSVDLSGIRSDQRNVFGITRDGSRLGIDKIEVVEYVNTIEKTVANFMANKQHNVFTCSALSGTALNSCLDRELIPIVYRLWRRPVDNSTKAEFHGFFQGKTFTQGLKYALNVALVSPKFFFLSYDDDNENRVLNSFEIAERLSLLVWTRVPTVSLLETARTKNLADKNILLAEFRKLMDLDAIKSDPTNRNLDRDKSWNFFLELQNQWLKLDEIADIEYPTRGVGEHLKWSTMFFIEEHFRKNKTVKDMMTADFTVVTGISADLYGATFSQASVANYDIYNTPQRFRKLSLSGSKRRGLLAQAGILAVNSGSKLNSEVNPTHRGMWHAQNILCDLPGALPSEVTLAESVKSNNISLKEKFKVHTDSPACIGCHKVMDPVGFGLWEYDELGLLRDKDKGGFSIIPDGELYSQFFTTSNQLLDIIANNEKTEACFMTHLATYSAGREINNKKSCTTQKILNEVRAKKGGMLDLLEGVITSDLFTRRQKR